jgi:2-keto-4-pentenoate hydratase/2-oxohepta-3-ene-1,7-dioic acid hydratase in catechol pathway
VPADEPGLDWEVELAVIIGERLTAATDPADTSPAVLGYTVFNDVSARTHQRATTQWANGKNADQSGPVGSFVVTADELDVADLRLRTTVNGQVMQDGSTAEMAIKIPDLLAYATRTISLRPGDVIATGTPAGVGFRRQPPVLMHPGDSCTVEIEGIGSVTNPIVDASHRH